MRISVSYMYIKRKRRNIIFLY